MKAILGILVVSLLGSAALAYGLSTEFQFSFNVKGSPLGTTANSTHIFSVNNTAVTIFDSSGITKDSFLVAGTPGDIAVNSTHIFVLTTGDDDIKLFDLSGNPDGIFTAALLAPSGIALNSTHVFVADPGNTQVEIFDSSGVSRDTIPVGGTLADPVNVAVDSNGRIIVLDDGGPTAIDIYDSSGNYLNLSFGTITTPIGLDVDSNNRIIVSDVATSGVLVFNSLGNLLTTFGGSGTGDGQFTFPAKLAVDSNDRIIVPDGAGPSSRIQVFVYATESSTGGGGGSYKHKTAPTSGLDWTTHRQIVTDGFRINDFIVTIDDNWWTDFPEQRILLMMPNEFEIKTYAQNGGLLVQELCFGLAEVGLTNTAEVCLEAWYDYQQNIVELKVIQETDVIDVDQVYATTSEKKCSESGDMKCTSTLFHNVKFKESMRYNVMAIKSIDQSRRSMMPTSLNDGIDLIGVSINPKPTMTIPGIEKYEGLITITQIEKYSNLWISDDGRIFDVNSSGSASIVDKDYTRHRDTDAFYMDRNHSEFDKLIAWTQQNAINVFDSSKLQKPDKGFIPPAIDEDGIDHRTETLAKLDVQD